MNAEHVIAEYNWLPPAAPYWELNQEPGMCPDMESNQQTFGA